ncbi:ImmA/IrrE family metallo-endopeptidase [Nitrobacter sp. TKz-YC02]|uniref:ImmA/IrrE family metallo-endopeptidase n=1 Tax=Nitrobacter sp. TKz-YC02 TaxID=3398704 RepID=UPI003CEE88E0
MEALFNKTRLTVARQRASLTKTELARRIGIEPRAISGFEAGQYLPADDTVEKIALALRYPKEFFFADDIDMLQAEGVSFRSMSRMTSRQRDAAIAAGALAYVLSDWLEAEFDLPDVDLPDLREDTPETAAMSLRHYWGLGERPIKNIIHLLELKGVRVFSLAENSVTVDAYSVWRGHRPCVFLNTGKSAERRRFDAAHELGHLVLHKHAAPSGLDAEKEANAFASAFLMPIASMKSLGRLTTIDQLVAAKKKWIVSVAALAYRMHDLRLISDWNYHTLCVQISQRGYRKDEPDSAQNETSQVWQKVLADMRRDGQGLQSLADKLLIPNEELVKLVFGLVTVGLPANSVSKKPPATRSHLRLVT